MKLFANGCSFTWGGAIYPSLYDEYGRQLDWWNPSTVNQQRICAVWPSKLAGHLNMDHVNLSMGCGSNSRIVRTTLGYFTDLISGGQYQEEWIAVIQWSMAPRFEFHDDISGGWALCMPNGSMTDVQTDYTHRQYIDNFKNMYYQYTDNRTWSQRYFSEVVTLACFFEKHRIQYWFSNLDKEVFDYLDTWQQDYLRNHCSWIGGGPWINFGSLFEERHDSGSGHPSELGHTQIADSIYQHIKEQI